MILYPHLIKQVELHSNPYATQFWRGVLERICIGDPPFGTALVSDTLVYKKQHLPLAQANAIDVMTFFQENVGLRLDFVQFATWKEIKRKVIKDNLIQDFVTRSQQQFELDAKESHRLLSTIHLYLTIKRILPHEIHVQTYPHMYIEQIDGISFRAGGRFVYTPLADRDLLSESSDDLDEDEDTQALEEEDDFTTALPEEPDEDESIE